MSSGFCSALPEVEYVGAGELEVEAALWVVSVSVL